MQAQLKDGSLKIGKQKALWSAQHDYCGVMGPFSLTYNIYRPPSTHEGVSGFLSIGFENNGSVEWDNVVLASSGVGLDDEQGVAWAGHGMALEGSARSPVV